MPPHPRDGDDTAGGGSSGALWYLFFLLLGAGAGAWYWFRMRRREPSFRLHDLPSSGHALRLSTDGPPADEFINNGSTDSLPALAAADVPFLPAAAAEADAARHGLPSAPPAPNYRDDDPFKDGEDDDGRTDPLGAVRMSPAPRTVSPTKASPGTPGGSRHSSRRSSRNWSRGHGGGASAGASASASHSRPTSPPSGTPNPFSLDDDSE